MTLNYFASQRLRIYQTIFIMLVLVNSIKSQTSTKLYIAVRPHTTLMKINNDTIALTSERKIYQMGLKPGLCPIELWAPGYNLIKDTIDIIEGSLNKYAKLLVEKTPEFEEYERLDKEYTKQVRIKKRKKAGLITLGVLFSYYVVDSERSRIMKYRRKADRAYNNYISAAVPSILELEYNNYLDAQENHNKAVMSSKNRLKIGIPLVILASVGTLLQIKKINKKKLPEKPVFEAGPPFTKSNRRMEFETFGGSTELGVRITF